MARKANSNTPEMGLNGRQRPESQSDNKARRSLQRLNASPRGGRKTNAKDSTKGSSSGLFSGNVLYSKAVRRYYPFVFYCFALIMVYMGFRFAGHSLQREEISCRIELQHLRSKALIISTQRLEAVSHDNLIEEIERRGLDLKQHNTPPMVIDKR